MLLFPVDQFSHILIKLLNVLTPDDDLGPFDPEESPVYCEVHPSVENTYTIFINGQLAIF